jgi:hypothetical protein
VAWPKKRKLLLPKAQNVGLDTELAGGLADFKQLLAIAAGAGGRARAR